MSDQSDSVAIQVAIQQAMQRLVRWHGASPGRLYQIYTTVWPEPKWADPVHCVCVDEHGTNFIARGGTAHEAITEALNKAGAPT